MRCRACYQAKVNYVESRIFNAGGQVWLYKCPSCKAEYIAKRDSSVNVPVVARITSAEKDKKTLPGIVVSAPDILMDQTHIAVTHDGRILALQRADGKPNDPPNEEY